MESAKTKALVEFLVESAKTKALVYRSISRRFTKGSNKESMFDSDVRSRWQKFECSDGGTGVKPKWRKGVS